MSSASPGSLDLSQTSISRTWLRSLTGTELPVRYILTGTQDGGDLQTPEGIIHATHKHIKVDGAEFFTFDEHGKLVDLVTIERLDQLLQQLKPPQ